MSPSLSNYFKRKQKGPTANNFLYIIFKRDRRTIEDQLSRLSLDNPGSTFEYRLKSSEKKLAWQKWWFWAATDNSNQQHGITRLNQQRNRQRAEYFGPHGGSASPQYPQENKHHP